jgi:hypothetical protein
MERERRPEHSNRRDDDSDERERESQSSNGKIVEGCVLYSRLSQWEKHFETLSSLTQSQQSAIIQTEKLSEVQTRLASGVEALSESLDNGFKMGEHVVQLFGRVVFVFLAVVVILALVIIWIARLDVSYKDGNFGVGHPSSHSQPHEQAK